MCHNFENKIISDINVVGPLMIHLISGQMYCAMTFTNPYHWPNLSAKLLLLLPLLPYITCYLVNRSPSTTIDCKTPYEAWSNAPTDYSNCKTIGCHAYCHENESKLEARSKKCIFLSYANGLKAYKLWWLLEYVWHSWICKGLTHEGELGQCRRESQVRGRFIVSALASDVSHIIK
jgi:hypothetical protein